MTPHLTVKLNQRITYQPGQKHALQIIIFNFPDDTMIDDTIYLYIVLSSRSDSVHRNHKMNKTE